MCSEGVHSVQCEVCIVCSVRVCIVQCEGVHSVQ